MTTMTFKVYSPDDGYVTSLGTLTTARDKEVRGEYNWTGEGKFTINRHDGAAAWFPEESFLGGNNRLVRCFLNAETTAFFAFFVETGKIVAVSSDEEGGETMELEGRGIMSVLEQFCLQNQIYATGDVDGPLDSITATGEWHWTRDNISIMTRFMEEAQAFGCFPEVSYTFSRTVDSNGDPHSADPDPPEVRYPVGIDGLQLMAAMQKTKLYAYMDPDFTLRLYDTEQGDTLGFTFEYADNIRQAAEKDFDEAVGAYASHVLVEGDTAAGTRIYRLREAGAHDRTVVRFLPMNETPSTALLDRAGDRDLAERAKLAGGPASIGVLIKTNQVPFVDYFPGDFATIDIPDVYDAATAQITAITLTETVSDNGDIDPILEFDGTTARAITPRPQKVDDCCSDPLPPIVIVGGDPDVSGFSCVARDSTTYSYTAGGARSILGPAVLSGGILTFTSTTFVQYNVGAGSPAVSEYPTSGLVQNWGNGGACDGVFTSGGVDYGTGGIPTIMRITVVGPGTLTIHTSVHPGGHAGSCGTSGNIVATASVSGIASVVDTDTQPAGTDLTIVIPDDGECVHHVDIEGATGPWGYGGAVWAPTVPTGSVVDGQPVVSTSTGDGSTTSYVTPGSPDPIPYQAGSFRIEVGGLDWTLSANETDPTTGSYTLDYAPPLGSTVQVWFTAA